ncbi:MAG TPA: hypothetical protein VMT52_09400 [Planctomycetota bacterium]|nr:hypothetical protein [Planctomycetota bacterium]
MIQTQCDACKKRYSVPDAHAGKKMRCKQCSAIVSIPPAADVASGPADVPDADRDSPRPTLPASHAAAASEAKHPPASGAKHPHAFGPRRPALGKLPPRRAGGTKVPVPGRKGFVRKRPDADRVASSAPRPRGRATGRAREMDAAESAGASAAAKKKQLVLIGIAAAVLLGGLFLAWQYFQGDSTPPRRGRGDSSLTATGSPATPAAVGKEEDAKAPDGAEPLEPLESPVPEVDAVQVPVDPLAVMPRDVNILARFQIAQLVNLLEVREDLQNLLNANEEAAPVIDETGFDPLSVGSVWVGTRLALDAPPNVESVEWIAVIEGAFENEKMASGLKKLAMVAEKESVQGKLTVLDCVQDGKHFGFLTFVAPGQAILGTDALFGEAVKLLGAPPSAAVGSTAKPGAGGSLRENKKLAEITDGFTPKGVIWAAAEFPEQPKNPLETGPGASGKGAPEEGGAPPPMSPMQAMPIGGVLSLDGVDGEGLVLEAEAIYPSPDEMKKAQSMLGFLLVTMKQSAPPDLGPLLEAIKMKPSGRKIVFTAKIPPEAVAMLRSQMKAGAGPPPEGEEDAGLPEEGEEPAPGEPVDDEPVEDEGAGPEPDPETDPESEPGDAGGTDDPE